MHKANHDGSGGVCNLNRDVVTEGRCVACANLQHDIAICSDPLWFEQEGFVLV